MVIVVDHIHVVLVLEVEITLSPPIEAEHPEKILVSQKFLSQNYPLKLQKRIFQKNLENLVI